MDVEKQNSLNRKYNKSMSRMHTKFFERGCMKPPCKTFITWNNPTQTRKPKK